MTKTAKNTAVSISKAADLPEVKEHYQDYPYPYRNPEDERTRLLSIVGEYLGELNHWLYNGKQDFKSGFRVLIAGGGTGDSVVYMGEQLKNTNAEIVYLDFSKASMEIAQKRAEIRGIKNVTWINDSILNIPKLKLGKFNYINCSGVLHHLQSPPEGLSILKSCLTADGGMGLMVYAKYGRTGVYQIQEIMKMVNAGVKNRAQEIMNGKAIISILPASNWYIRAQELLGDHIHHGDVGLYDMFLHKQDRAYSIPELYGFVNDAGLHFVEFSDILERLQLRVENYIKDFSLLQKIKQMDIVTQQAICELIIGSIIKHSFYVSNKKDTVATIDDLDNIPYFYTIAGVPQKICEIIEANQVSVGQVLNLTLNNGILKNVNISIPVSAYTKHIFHNMADGSKSLKEIFASVREDLQQEVPDAVLANEVKSVFTPFISAGILLLRNKKVAKIV